MEEDREGKETVTEDSVFTKSLATQEEVAVDENSANFTHNLFSRKPVSTRMSRRIDRSRGLKSPPRGVLTVRFKSLQTDC